jgi:putative tributyrin esterase
MKRLVLLLLVVGCSSKQSPTAAKGSDVATPPSPPAVAEKAGRVETKTFQSTALGVEKEYVVYLPAGYDEQTTRRYPVFYYLHGLGGNETNWSKGGELGTSADKLGLQAIVVMPDGDDGFYADSPSKIDYDACMKDGTGLFLPGMQNRAHTCVKQRRYETYIIKDLVGEIDAKYRTIATREGRAIAGLSMGGFGALQLGMRHPDLFAAAASHSGVDALLYAGPYPYEKGKVKLISQADIAKYGKGNPDVERIGLWIQTIFGPDIAVWKSYDPAVLAEKVEPGKPALYLECGTEDGFGLHNGAQYLHDILTDRKIDHVWYLGPGTHDFRFWKVRLPESLKFLRDHTTKPQ